jgi:pimeloyl-ACP methyl ester carboxylesterase
MTTASRASTGIPRRRRSPIAGVVGLAVLAAAVACSSTPSTDGAAPGGTSPGSPAPQSATTGPGPVEERRIALPDGREIYLRCQGSGSPTVLFESGYHDSSDLWSETDATPPVPPDDAFTQVSRLTRACAYDRPGTLRYTDGTSGVTDRSSPVAMPRTAADVVTDLHDVLAAAGETGPYVLVAHSLGGLFARLYAQTHPDDVAGIVFVDSFPIEIPALFGSKWPAYRDVLNGAGSQPDPAFEQIDVDASITEVHEATPLDPAIPMLVLTKTEPFGGLPTELEGFTAEDLEQAWGEGAASLVALGTQTPHWFVTGSDHYVQVHQPDLVAAAALVVLDREQAAG